MEAAMGTTGNKGLAKKPAYSTDHMRGLDQSMFIDLNYETPINSNGNGGAGIGNQPQQQKENQGQGQGQTPYPPYQQLNQMYMNPQMNMSMPQQQQQQLYMHPGPSNTSFVPYAGNPYQANASKQIRQRRNSGSSVNTTSTSVNKFMKKQWNKFGGGGKNSNSHGSTAFDGDGDNDGDGMDGTVEMNTVDTEISFDDLKHIRGDRIGSFGLTDSTPYIPTLKVSSSANGSKISGDQYRKLQMAQKKAMAINFSKQRDQIVQNNMAPPRSMSLQSYAGNRPPGYANYYGMTPNMPSNMQMNVPYGMPYPQQMGMGANRMPGQMPGPGFIPQQGQGPVFSGSNGPAPYGFPPMGPRSMSLQSGNSMPQNQWRDGQVNRMNQINENSQNSYGYQPNSSLPNQSNMETATAEAGSKNLEQKSKVNLSSDEASKPVEEKRAKTVNKIDFNSLSDVELDEEDTGNAYSEIKKDNTDVEEERNDKLSPLPSNSNSPVKKSVNQRVHHENTRSGVDSVVTFESFNQKDQKTQQGAMYGLKNNSTQQTVFYSATEFPNHSSSKFFEKNTDPETNSVINAADKNNSEITSNDDVNKGNSKPDENKKEAESNASQYVDISELNNTLDQMALKLTPVINQGTFENNYGSYGNQEDDILGNEQDENDNTVRYSTMTVTQPLHLTDDGESPNREKLTAKVKFPVTEDIKKQKRGEEENEREVEDNHPLVETEKYLETSSPIKDTKSEELGSPMKSNKSLIDMTINLNSKESSPLKYSSSTKIPQINFEKPIKEKLSHVDEIAGISDIGTPSKGVFYDNEPLTPMSDGSSTYFSSFTPEQYGLLNDNAKLLKELELVTTELASSVSREIMLEDNLRKSIASISNNKLTSSSEDVGDAVPVNFDLKDTKGLTVKENGEIELDTNIAHGSIQYATAITSLAKQLNKERSKRYIVEEMLLEYQQNSDLSQLQKSLLDEKKAMKELRNKYNDIVESTRLHRTEKELLEVENQALKLEIEQLERKYNNLETEIVPKLKAQIELLEERTDE